MLCSSSGRSPILGCFFAFEDVPRGREASLRAFREDARQGRSGNASKDVPDRARQEPPGRPVMMGDMRILLTGISGFAGAALLPRLLEQGHEVRALARDRGRVELALQATSSPTRDPVGLRDFELTIGDTLSGAGMLGALRGVEVAYYLIHSMEPSPSGPGGDLPARERASAQTFAHAARAAGVGGSSISAGRYPTITKAFLPTCQPQRRGAQPPECGSRFGGPQSLDRRSARGLARFAFW